MYYTVYHVHITVCIILFRQQDAYKFVLTSARYTVKYITKEAKNYVICQICQIISNLRILESRYVYKDFAAYYVDLQGNITHSFIVLFW